MRTPGFYWILRDDTPVHYRPESEVTFTEEPEVAQWTGKDWLACGWDDSLKERQVRVLEGPINVPDHRGTPDERCTFCNKPKAGVGHLISAPNSRAFICDGCLGLCETIREAEGW